MSSERFTQPTPVRDIDIAFGGRIAALLPPTEEIPAEFDRWSNPWNEFITGWLFEGVTGEKLAALTAKAGVDKDTALRHLAAVLSSFEPKHEHKTAGCAYLASLWFEAVP
jgi:hypothetical protein